MLLHPLVVHFPLALRLTSLLFDVLAWRRANPLYRQTAYWLVGLGLVGAAASIALGWIDLLAQERAGVGTAAVLRHRTHAVLAYAATVAYLANFLWRWRTQNRAVAGPLGLSVLGGALIAVTGYLGGELRNVM